ncbi:MAG: metal-dependent hydrolase [Chitinophagaceae bacterium]
MDSLTHIVLGACVGELLAGKKMGRKAMLWGAAAQSLPDIDFIASLWSSPAQDLLAHRGFTHSFLFIVLLTPLLSFLASGWNRSNRIILKDWLIFFSIQMAIHVLIDVMNVYGTGWFEPFSHTRVACDVLFVADPLLTISLVMASFVLLFRKGVTVRRRWALGAVMISLGYLIYAGYNKWTVSQVVESSLASQKISHQEYFTTPTPFNSWLWYVVVKDTAGFHIGYRSVFDKTSTIPFYYVPRQDSLLAPVRGQEDLQHLLRFSKGYYVVQQWGDSLVLSDLRFGQIMGWQNPSARFVFYYYLQHPEANELLVQRGRMAGWDYTAWQTFVQRIKGVK